MAILCRNFYTGNTVDIARSLVGCYLVRRYEGELLVCRITETEAYVGAIDKAAHSYGYHKTARNATMFGPPAGSDAGIRAGRHLPPAVRKSPRPANGLSAEEPAEWPR